MDEIRSVKPRDTFVLFGYQGRDYKFVSFLADSADNAFHFRLFRKAATSDGGSTGECDIIRIQLPETGMESFEGGKLSVIDDKLTQSKIIKRMGHSAHGDLSLRSGANFKILSIAPEHPSGMVEISGRDERDIHFALQGDAQPFVVNFIVHRKSSEEMPSADRNDLMGGQFMQCRFENMDFDLLITLSKIPADAESGEVKWPPHSVVLKRTGR